MESNDMNRKTLEELMRLYKKFTLPTIRKLQRIVGNKI